MTQLWSEHPSTECRARQRSGLSLTENTFPAVLWTQSLFCEGDFICTDASQAGPVGFRTRKQSLRLYIYYVEVARETETTSCVNVGPASCSRSADGSVVGRAQLRPHHWSSLALPKQAALSLHHRADRQHSSSRNSVFPDPELMCSQ